MEIYFDILRYNPINDDLCPRMYVLLLVTVPFSLSDHVLDQFCIIAARQPAIRYYIAVKRNETEKIYASGRNADHEKYYYILLIIMYYSYIVNTVIVLAIDIIYFVFIEHACALFDILKYETILFI